MMMLTKNVADDADADDEAAERSKAPGISRGSLLLV